MQGEIVIGGECVAEGYYKNPEKSKEEFIEAEGRRWFRSGDIGELHHDGCIKIIGECIYIYTTLKLDICHYFSNFIKLLHTKVDTRLLK